MKRETRKNDNAENKNDTQHPGKNTGRGTSGSGDKIRKMPTEKCHQENAGHADEVRWGTVSLIFFYIKTYILIRTFHFDLFN